MIHLFHGFLGSPKDFNFLKNEKNVHLHDLLTFDFNHFHPSEDDVLVGYSMGGRICLEIASKFEFNIKQIILINSHPGVEKEEKLKRKKWEDEVLEEMNHKDFLNYWNKLPIFKEDLPLSEIETERLDHFKDLFHRFRLSEQENFLPLIKKYKSKVCFIIGKNDSKYFEMAQKKLIPENIKCHIVDGGHRLFQTPEALKSVLKFEGII